MLTTRFTPNLEGLHCMFLNLKCAHLLPHLSTTRMDVIMEIIPICLNFQLEL
ncbi:hypothetical protein Lalb_Chr03g0039541 [Lupinus albus]|uniref:Uncharacterized protein n=1 Tax=Lupinus albus TaxID=3870 RepID=A0A6A4QXY7_LUPAL|nr:hypothetical protein Lalb_Chr03g0039541 [Lupinus albus]